MQSVERIYTEWMHNVVKQIRWIQSAKCRKTEWMDSGAEKVSGFRGGHMSWKRERAREKRAREGDRANVYACVYVHTHTRIYM